MGLDAYFIVKFTDDTPKEVRDKFEVFHDSEVHGNGYNRWQHYHEMAYFRKFFKLQDLIERESREHLTFDKYYFRVSKSTLKDIYFDIWNEMNRHDMPQDDVNHWDYYIDSPYADTLGELESAEGQIFDMMKYFDFIEDVFYYASW